MESSEGMDGRARISGTVPLPVLKDRVALVLGSDADVETLDKGGGFTNEDRSFESGIRFLSGDGPWTYKMNLGAQWSDGPVIYVRPGVRYEGHYHNDDYRVGQYLLWNNQDGFGEQTDFEYDRCLHPNLYLRSKSSALISEVSDGLEFSQAFILRYRSSNFWATSLEYGFKIESDPALAHERSSLAFRFRSIFLFPWLEQEIQPFVRFENSKDFRPSPGIVFKVKILFEHPLHGRGLTVR